MATEIKSAIHHAANVEREGLVTGATDALTDEASRKRGERMGRGLAAGATENEIAKDLGIGDKNALRRMRREDPGAVLSALFSGR